MYTINDVKRLAGLTWDEFFRLVDHKQTTKQSVSLSMLSKCNEDVAMLPYKKATCYGFCSVTETPKLVKCQSCGLVVKTVAFGHHQKIHHSHFCPPTHRSTSSDSDSDDDCQGFLLSPPHHPIPTVPPPASETMLNPKFVEDAKWAISDSLKKRPMIDERNARKEDEKTSQQSPPRYDVQRRNDLRLVLTKRRSSITKTKTHKMGIGRNQSTPLVSISITRSSGPKRNCVEITEHNSKPNQTVNNDKAKGFAAIRLNANEKCNRSTEWPNVQLTDDIFMADLEESEQSSIPLHHSPSESSDSDVEGNDQQSTEARGELLEGSYLRSPHNFVQEHCLVPFPIENTAGWNPRNAAERPSKSNSLALQHKKQQKKDFVQRNDGVRSRAMEQSIAQKRTILKGEEEKSATTANSAGMDVVVEKLFKIQGISVMALSPDGKRKLAMPKQKHVPSVETDSRVQHHLQFLNKERNSNGQRVHPPSPLDLRQKESSNSSFQLRMARPSAFSPSLTFCPLNSSSLPDESSQLFNLTPADESSSEPQKSERNSPINSLPFGTFSVKQQTAQRKTSASFAGVNWHKFDSQSIGTHCQSNVPKMQNVNLQKGILRFVPLLNSADESIGEKRQEDSSTRPTKHMEKTAPIRETNAVHLSSLAHKFTETYNDAQRRADSDLQSAEFACHVRQNSLSSSDGSQNSAAFFGQNPNRKRSFIQQQQMKQQMPQQPIVNKRFRPIAPRKRLYNDHEFDSFSVPSKSCAAEASQHQQPILPCRPSHSQQIFDQRFHPKILSVFSPPPYVGSFGSAHEDQLSPSADFRAFGGRQSRHLSSVQSHHQTHSIRQSRAQFPSFDASFIDDSRPPKYFDPQIGGVHGSVGLVAQRIPPEYSHSQMNKTTAPCAHLHQCQTYGGPIATPSPVPCSSAFLFATSPPPHPPSSSSFNGPFPSVHQQLSDSLSSSHQQHFLLHPQQQHFHPLTVLPSPHCRHNCARPSLSSVPPSMHGQFSVCRGGVFAGMASSPSDSFFVPPSYTFQQQQISHRFMRGQQQRQNCMVNTYDNEMDPEICAIEPPPVLEAEGNITTSAEEGGGTARSDSDASDMDLREILPQQQ